MKPLTERDLETLADLVYSRFESRSKSFYEHGVGPINFGGSNGSHHGKTATKLVAHGFVEHRQRGAAWGDVTTRNARGSKVYRATEAGRKAIGAWNELRKWDRNEAEKLAHGKMLTDKKRKLLRERCHLDMPI